MRSMLRRIGVVVVAFGFAGCMNKTLEDQYREAVPRAESVSVAVPGDSAGSTSGAASAALIGERAPLYQVTRDTSRLVNGSLWVVLALVRAIVEQEPTTIDASQATWGPWNETLSPITYLFTVEKIEEGRFQFRLDGKPRAAGDDAYVTLLAGESELDATDKLERGTIGLDFDAAHALDAGEHPLEGKVAASYDIAADPRVVEAAFDTVHAPGTEAVSALYRYTEASDGSGTFEFGAKADLSDAGANVESLVMTSRWNDTGAGRGDVVATGGDIGAGVFVQASECWDTSFARTYYTDSAGLAATEGDASACAYSEPLWADMPMP